MIRRPPRSTLFPTRRSSDLPGPVNALVDDWLDGDVPQVVVSEPEHWIADNRVMKVIRIRVGVREEDREHLVRIDVRIEGSARNRELTFDICSRSGHPGGLHGVRE